MCAPVRSGERPALRLRTCRECYDAMGVIATPADLLDSQLSNVLKPEAARWLSDRAAESAALDLATPAGVRALAIAHAQVARRLPRVPLGLAAAAASALRREWDPSRWTAVQAGRARLLAALPAADAAALVAAVDRLAEHADLDELVAIHQALPLLPHPERWTARAAEGLRSAMTAVYAAVALDNPYPSEQLAEGAWNQLVLKALSVGCPLDRIVGLDRRANAALAASLADTARERFAAGRPVNPQLWRCVGPFARAQDLPLFERLIASPDAHERAAATLALAACPLPAAAPLRARCAPPPPQGWSLLA